MGGAREPAQTTTERPRRSLHKHQRCRLGPKNSVSWWDEQHSPISQPHTPNVSLSVTDYPMSSAQWSAALLAQQLPPIHMFTGEEATDGRETFTDWIEQLEMVASISWWDERTKLVNLTTHLKGQAYAFYKSCTEQQWKDYTALVSELTKRFTPVCLRAVQSGLFHDTRQHHPKESVDVYAQDLQCLFYLAYPQQQ